MSDKYGADVLTERETHTGTWEWNGNEYKLVVEAITKEDLNTLKEQQRLTQKALQGEEVGEIPNFSFTDESDADRGFIDILIDYKLKKPDVDPEKIDVAKLTNIFEGMIAAWQGDIDVAQAKREMPIEGNR